MGIINNMPRGRGKGGKNRKKAKANQQGEKRDLEFKEDGQEYGQVLRMLGSGRIECMCPDGKKKTCTIRGAMKKRVWIHAGDVVLLGLREDFNDDGKADVMLKYYDYEARELQEEYGEIPAHWKIGEGGNFDSDEDGDGAYMGGGDSDEEEKKDEDEAIGGKKEAVNVDDI